MTRDQKDNDQGQTSLYIFSLTLKSIRTNENTRIFFLLNFVCLQYDVKPGWGLAPMLEGMAGFLRYI